jgi:competence protein ComGC
MLIFLISLMLVPFVANNSHNALALNETGADAKTAIAEAQEVIINCYAAALDAENSGANITQLLSAPNEAGMFLSKANLAYSEGNFSSAVYFANLARTQLDGFLNLAQTLKEKGIQQRNQDFIINIVGSIAGSGVTICGGLAVFFLLRRKYGKTEGAAV